MISRKGRRNMSARSHPRRAISNLQKGIMALGALLVFRLITAGRILPSLHTTPPPAAKIAFFIQVTASTVLHVPRLLQALHHPENIYAIHFDTRIPARQTSLIKFLLNTDENFNNVIVLPTEPISYAGVTMLLNTLNAIETLLRVSPDWEFFINLSGADYPLVSPTALRKLFALPPVRGSRLNMLQRQEADRDMTWFFNKRLGTIHVDPALYPPLSQNATEILDLETAHPLSRVNRNNLPFVKSEGWVTLHRSFAEHSVHSGQGRRLLLSYATARAPDELFFGSLLESSDFKTTLTWDALRYVVWGLHGVRWARPAFLDDMEADVRDSLSSSGALFARKFARPESDLMDFIDANISGIREYSNDSAVEEFYQRTRTRLVCIAKKREFGACTNVQV